MKVNKHANSRLRRRKISKSIKGRKSGKRGLAKTRRMRGRGWFDWMTGSAAAQSGSAESAAESTAGSAAGYTSLAGPAIADGPSAGYAGKPEPVSNVPFKDSYGSGTYTGDVVKLPNGFKSRQGIGKMTYADGTMYIGEYQGNKRNGTGTIYGTKLMTLADGKSVMSNTMLEIRWNNDKAIDGTYTKKYYDGDRKILSRSVVFGNTVKDYGLEEMADASTGFGMVKIDPDKILRELYPKHDARQAAIAQHWS